MVIKPADTDYRSWHDRTAALDEAKQRAGQGPVLPADELHTSPNGLSDLINREIEVPGLYNHGDRISPTGGPNRPFSHVA